MWVLNIWSSFINVTVGFVQTVESIIALKIPVQYIFFLEILLKKILSEWNYALHSALLIQK